jgi:hypothetical protein
VNIDLADIVAMLAHMVSANQNDSNYVASWMRREVLAHELVHITGLDDPPPGLGGSCCVIARVNTILGQLSAGFYRKYYAYCNPTTHHAVTHYVRGAADVILDGTTLFNTLDCDPSCNVATRSSEPRSFALWFDPLTSCPVASVGGIAVGTLDELGEEHQTTATQHSNEGWSPLIAVVLVAAACCAVVLVFAAHRQLLF